MLTSKFLATAVATIAVAGTIGLAVAQTTPSIEAPNTVRNPNTGNSGTAGSTGSSGMSGTTGNTGTTGTTGTTGATGSNANRDSSATTGTSAGSTMTNEARARGDLN